MRPRSRFSTMDCIVARVRIQCFISLPFRALTPNHYVNRTAEQPPSYSLTLVAPLPVTSALGPSSAGDAAKYFRSSARCHLKRQPTPVESWQYPFSAFPFVPMDDPNVHPPQSGHLNGPAARACPSALKSG